MLIISGDQVYDDVFVFASDLFDYTFAIVVIRLGLHLQIVSPTGMFCCQIELSAAIICHNNELSSS